MHGNRHERKEKGVWKGGTDGGVQEREGRENVGWGWRPTDHKAKEAQGSGSSLLGDPSKYFFFALNFVLFLKKGPQLPNGTNFQPHKMWITPLGEQSNE